MQGMPLQTELGGTTACCLRLADESKFPDDEGPEGFKGDAWFGSVKAASMAAAKGFRCILQVKGNKALYPKDYIAGIMKNCPGGVLIVLKGTHPSGKELVAI